ncbi:MAG: hypothetical protein JSW53_04425 [Candidatus Bathyarchaeota archaeon]|nr:MAG: hypothetical protein JSW53_04425 [Candidatus Bathyarchaeota archaeon]
MEPLTAIPPSKFEAEHIKKLIQKKMKKRGRIRGKVLEDITRKGIIWMPYHRIQFNYSGKRNEIKQGETALNAMFCGAVRTNKEFLMLFRPNYLKYKTVSYSPRSEELVGPIAFTDFDSLFKRLLEHLNRVRDELNELRSKLSKSRVRIRRYSVIIPMRGELKKEKKLAEETAKLSAMKNVIRMCFNVDKDISSAMATSSSVFFYPTLVATLRSREDGVERHLIIDLVARGVLSKHSSFDKGLTKLCNENEICGEIIISSFPQ